MLSNKNSTDIAPFATLSATNNNNNIQGIGISNCYSYTNHQNQSIPIELAMKASKRNDNDSIKSHTSNTKAIQKGQELRPFFKGNSKYLRNSFRQMLK